MIAYKWYNIAQTSTIGSSCSVNITFGSSNIVFSASVDYGVYSLNIDSCDIQEDYLLSVRLRQTGSSWYIDLFSNIDIEPSIDIIDGLYWTSNNTSAGSGTIVAIIKDISQDFNTEPGGGGGGDSGDCPIGINDNNEAYVKENRPLLGAKGKFDSLVIPKTIPSNLAEGEWGFYLDESGVGGETPSGGTIDEPQLWALLDATNEVIGESHIPTLGISKVSGLRTELDAKVNASVLASVATSGKYSDLSGTPTSLKNPYALTFGSKTYDGSSAKTITASDLGALTSHQSLDGYATEEWVEGKGYLTKSAAATTYATLTSLATTNSNLTTLRNEFDALERLLNDDTSGVIDTWNEVVEFLEGYSDSEDLASILSAINGNISTLQGYFTDGSANNALKLGGILAANYWHKGNAGSTSYNWSAKKLVAKTLVVPTTAPTDLSSGEWGIYLDESGVGAEIPTTSSIDEDTFWSLLGTNITNKVIDDVHIPSLGISKISGLRTELDSKLNSTALNGYATEEWVEGKGYTTNKGTVTSVAMSVPTGFAISGTPITTSGTLALTFASGYSLPTTAKQSNWDTAYSWGNHASKGYALASALATTNSNLTTLRNEFDALERLLNDDTSGVIDTWNEVVEFLEGYSDSEDLASILSVINGNISTLQGYFTDGSANNALKLGGIAASNYWHTGNAGSTSYNWSAKKLIAKTLVVPTTAPTDLSSGEWGFYLDESGVGAEVPSGGGSGVDEEELWAILATDDSSNIIHSSHIPTLGISKVSGLRAELDAKVNASALASVATSGKYSDLSGTPTSLKNPTSLSWSGYSSGSYDGSSAKSFVIPTSLPASDVYSWAKASSKPSYTTTEVSEGSNLYFTNTRAISACDGTYLKLSGGTIENNNTWDILKIVSTHTNGRQISFHSNKEMCAIGDNDANGTYIYSSIGGTSSFLIGVNRSGVAYVSKKGDVNTRYDILHSGNYTDYALSTSGGWVRGVITLSGYDSTNVPLNILTPSMGYTGYIRFGAASTSNELGHLGFSAKNTPAYSYEGTVYPLIHSGNIGSQSVTYATNTTRLYASDEPYRYGDPYPYYLKMRYNVLGDNSWYLSVYPENPLDVSVAKAQKLVTARSIWGQSFDGTANVSGNIHLGNYSDFEIGTGYSYDDTVRYNKIVFGSGTTGLQYHSGRWTGGNVASHKFIVGTPESTAMTIMNNGNVLIGTTTDSGYKLAVNGTTPSYFYNSNSRYSLVIDSGLSSKMITFGGWDSNEKAQIGYHEGSGFNLFNYQSYRNSDGARITAVGISDTGVFYVANSGTPSPDSATLKVEKSQVTAIGNVTATGDIESTGMIIPTAPPSNPQSGKWYFYLA